MYLGKSTVSSTSVQQSARGYIINFFSQSVFVSQGAAFRVTRTRPCAAFIVVAVARVDFSTSAKYEVDTVSLLWFAFCHSPESLWIVLEMASQV